MAGSQVLEVSFIQIILIAETAFSFCKFADFLLFQVQSKEQQHLVTWGLVSPADIQAPCQTHSIKIRLCVLTGSPSVLCAWNWRNTVLTQNSGSEEEHLPARRSHLEREIFWSMGEVLSCLTCGLDLAFLEQVARPEDSPQPPAGVPWSNSVSGCYPRQWFPESEAAVGVRHQENLAKVEDVATQPPTREEGGGHPFMIGNNLWLSGFGLT